MRLPTTPSQTVGPFFGPALSWVDGPFVVPDGTPGARWIRGRVLDGEGEPVTDALVETWQADPGDRHPPADADGAFGGFGRCATDRDGRYAILTLKPGSLDQAPHLVMAVFARGLLRHVVTRVYFPEDQVAHAADAVLAAVPPERRRTLMAAATDDGYVFDVHLQGERETVFFEF